MLLSGDTQNRLGYALGDLNAGKQVANAINNSQAKVGTIAAAGNSQGTATLITDTVSIVTGADGTKGVILPADDPVGALREVYSSVATNGLKVYPPTGGDINDGTANAAVTIEGKTLATFRKLDATTWAAQFTANT